MGSRMPISLPIDADSNYRRDCNQRHAACRRQRRQLANSAELLTLLEAIVAGGFDIEVVLLRLPSRGVARVALARQSAMYLAHTICGLSKTEVGRLFERDRTTVNHACSMVEQRRDDVTFDLALEHLERVVRVVLGPQEVRCCQ
jgi:chromosomal replication initiation ATPase DnaA